LNEGFDQEALLRFELVFGVFAGKELADVVVGSSDVFVSLDFEEKIVAGEQDVRCVDVDGRCAAVNQRRELFDRYFLLLFEMQSPRQS